MGGLDDLLAGSADRWAKAERRAEGVADLCLGRAVRNYFTLYLPIGAVVLFPTGASLGMLSFPDEASITNIFGFGCLLTGVGLMIGGLVSNPKSSRMLQHGHQRRYSVPPRRRTEGCTPADPRQGGHDPGPHERQTCRSRPSQKGTRYPTRLLGGDVLHLLPAGSNVRKSSPMAFCGWRHSLHRRHLFRGT